MVALLFPEHVGKRRAADLPPFAFTFARVRVADSDAVGKIYRWRRETCRAGWAVPGRAGPRKKWAAI